MVEKLRPDYTFTEDRLNQLKTKANEVRAELDERMMRTSVLVFSGLVREKHVAWRRSPVMERWCLYLERVSMRTVLVIFSLMEKI